MIEIPKGDTQEYLLACGVVAIYVAKVAWRERHCSIGATENVVEMARLLGNQSPPCIIRDAWWVRNRELADQVVSRANQRGRIGRSDAIAAVLEAAGALKIKLTPHIAVMMRAELAVARANEVLAEAKAKRELKWFNQAYRRARIRGEARMSYRQAVGRLRQAVLRRMAAKGRPELDQNMLDEIFLAKPQIFLRNDA